MAGGRAGEDEKNFLSVCLIFQKGCAKRNFETFFKANFFPVAFASEFFLHGGPTRSCKGSCLFMAGANLPTSFKLPTHPFPRGQTPPRSLNALPGQFK